MIVNGKLARFSVNQVLRVLTLLGVDIEFRTQAATGRLGRVSVREIGNGIHPSKQLWMGQLINASAVGVAIVSRSTARAVLLLRVGLPCLFGVDVDS